MRHEHLHYITRIYRILPSKHPWPCNFAPYQNLCLHWMPTQKHIHVSPHPLNCHISKIKKPNGIYMVVYTSLYGKSCWKYLPLIASCHLLCGRRWGEKSADWSRRVTNHRYVYSAPELRTINKTRPHNVFFAAHNATRPKYWLSPHTFNNVIFYFGGWGCV